MIAMFHSSYSPTSHAKIFFLLVKQHKISLLVDLSGLGLLTDEIKDIVNINVKLKGRPTNQRSGLFPVCDSFLS
jgi:hypothetical protein